MIKNFLNKLCERLRERFVKRESIFTEDILKHRTWLEREVQEKLIDRDITYIVRASENWYDKYK